jgi:7-cyano-7-deazaguanine reductase
MKPIGADLRARYRALDQKLKLMMEGEAAIRPDLLLCFPYRDPEHEAEVVIVTDEFSAVCPWTGLPDLGTLTVRYTPRRLCLELKSFKYYLLSYRAVGIVQEQAAARILQDLVRAVKPARLQVSLDYRVRGGLHTVVSVQHPDRAAVRPRPGRTAARPRR